MIKYTTNISQWAQKRFRELTGHVLRRVSPTHCSLAFIHSLCKTCGKLNHFNFAMPHASNLPRTKTPPQWAWGGVGVCSYLLDSCGGISLFERNFKWNKYSRRNNKANLSVFIISYCLKMRYIYLTWVQYCLLSFDFQILTSLVYSSARIISDNNSLQHLKILYFQCDQYNCMQIY